MAGAMGVAERLLALEAAVGQLQADLRALAAEGAGSAAGAQPRTRTKSRGTAESPLESAGAGAAGSADGPDEGGAAPPAAAGEEPSGPERLAQQLGNARMAAVLVRAGYTSPEAVAAASDEALLAIDGVGEKALQVIRERMRG